MALVSLEGRLAPVSIDLALEAGCHVMAEKPACVRAEDFAPLARKANEKKLLLMEKELREISDDVKVTTNDGSYGMKGMVTDALREILAERDVHFIIGIGPVPMMKAISEMTKPKGIKTMVSLNSVMVDGTGMCGSCRVTVGGETKFACVDGPDFDGHEVDWDELFSRRTSYVDHEIQSLCHWERESFGKRE